jgi:predicted Rossmann fold flavoprotein
VEADGRIFPKTGKAPDVLNVLGKYLKEHKVEVLFEADVQGLIMGDGRIDSVNLRERKILADKFILCTGGKSYPNTGSTGNGYDWARAVGHWIVKPRPALVPIEVAENWVKELQGMALRTTVNLLQGEKKQSLGLGDMMFTHFGLSGPLIINASKLIGECLAGEGEVVLELDLFPELSVLELGQKLQQDFIEHSKKDLKNYLAELLPVKLSLLLIKLAGADGKKKLNFVTKEERLKILELMKGLRFTVKGLQGYNQAMVTSGGVDLKEVDSKTMRSKIVNNLYFAGEVLDLDGPTGGYNLQVAWSTGYAAGTHAANRA